MHSHYCYAQKNVIYSHCCLAHHWKPCPMLWGEEESNHAWIGKEELNRFLFKDRIFVYVQIPSIYKKKKNSLEIVSGYRKTQNTKQMFKGFISFLHDNNKHLEFYFIRFIFCFSFLCIWVFSLHVYKCTVWIYYFSGEQKIVSVLSELEL